MEVDKISMKILFLSYYPLKQGLKRGRSVIRIEKSTHFYPTIH